MSLEEISNGPDLDELAASTCKLGSTPTKPVPCLDMPDAEAASSMWMLLKAIAETQPIAVVDGRSASVQQRQGGLCLPRCR